MRPVRTSRMSAGVTSMPWADRGGVEIVGLIAVPSSRASTPSAAATSSSTPRSDDSFTQPIDRVGVRALRR